ncbi:Uu.00g036210.m01.CDS01 [Anthostomella pinea]|uniref:protein disulfide-isomerase n=1 Tax=Anthostomella pinea TaxID=933095 RepID=A0AAI8V4H0_9PEZI|nr:Uu.00g036210.m01.CDS01 [Anthostomella pinea]
MHAFNFNPALAVAAVACLSALPTAHASLYAKDSPVVQVTAKNYDKLIKSNYTYVVEFYAPWCGHCKNLQPAYEKAARNLDGLAATVAAVNCDDDENKQLCGMMGVQGFPTLKTIRPGKNKGAPVIEDYNGPRTAKGIVDAVVDKINNHVKRLTDKDIESFLSTKNESAKAILFTEKGTTSTLLKSLAIDFLGVIPVAQVRNKEAKANQLFGIKSYPTLVLLPGGDKESLVYQGEMKKPAMLEFLSQVGEPNPDPATPKAQSKNKAGKKDKEKISKASQSSQSTDTPPAESKPALRELAPPIPAVTSQQDLTNECLNRKSPTCVLAFVPTAHDDGSETALASLSEIAFKHAQVQRHLFPFYEVHEESAASVFQDLGLTGKVQLVAVNAKRGWLRHYDGDFSALSVENWIDAIRMGEGAKEKLPEAVIGEVVEESETAETKPAETVEVKIEDSVEIEIESEPESTSWQGAEPTPEATEAPPKHEEL